MRDGAAALSQGHDGQVREYEAPEGNRSRDAVTPRRGTLVVEGREQLRLEPQPEGPRVEVKERAVEKPHTRPFRNRGLPRAASRMALSWRS